MQSTAPSLFCGTLVVTKGRQIEVDHLSRLGEPVQTVGPVVVGEPLVSATSVPPSRLDIDLVKQLHSGEENDRIGRQPVSVQSARPLHEWQQIPNLARGEFLTHH